MPVAKSHVFLLCISVGGGGEANRSNFIPSVSHSQCVLRSRLARKARCKIYANMFVGEYYYELEGVVDGKFTVHCVSVEFTADSVFVPLLRTNVTLNEKIINPS